MQKTGIMCKKRRQAYCKTPQWHMTGRSPESDTNSMPESRAWHIRRELYHALTQFVSCNMQNHNKGEYHSQSVS
jgi:hypothetical protein